MSTNFKDKVFKEIFEQLCEDYEREHPDMDADDGTARGGGVGGGWGGGGGGTGRKDVIALACVCTARSNTKA
jgi:hypothetical protein